MLLAENNFRIQLSFNIHVHLHYSSPRGGIFCLTEIFQQGPDVTIKTESPGPCKGSD